MKHPLRVLVASMALGLLSSTGFVSTASADVGPVKRISCPSVAELNRLSPDVFPNGPLVKLEATPISCDYFAKGETDTSLEVEFEDGVSTPKQAEDKQRAAWPEDYPYSFAPRPLQGLGSGAFYWADAGPSAVYWQLSPGVVAVMYGVWDAEKRGVPIAKLFRPMMEVYTIPGEETVNGRKWRTTCESYSATARCRTEIFASTVERTSTGYRLVNGWAFNSLTYRWSDRALWKNNPLAETGSWTSAEGRKWRTECDTSTTGQGACRSSLLTTVVGLKSGRYVQDNIWVFNNQVLFTN